MLVEEELTYGIRGCVYEVYRQLGAGFLEKVYEKALIRELHLQGVNAEAQVPLKVEYKGEVVGEYLAGILVEARVLVELKAQSELSKVHEAQLVNYMRASGKKVGLLVNFTHPKAEIRRVVI
ncbi:GxxExxY protein [Thiohalobacter thiocyanaticus]|uniref:GxxExxY protein n=1 Tax=Thiohalobacter thiocyanaticus TaxID=585455 RepID=A0A426QI51_9GAMM|nr:GxxExxY protein [Thiohalobacter thiocyanaticus]RRQ21425.1 GxxExxY protein [Thiohalobacter thiocyanaticus]